MSAAWCWCWCWCWCARALRLVLGDVEVEEGAEDVADAVGAAGLHACMCAGRGMWAVGSAMECMLAAGKEEEGVLVGEGAVCGKRGLSGEERRPVAGKDEEAKPSSWSWSPSQLSLVQLQSMEALAAEAFRRRAKASEGGQWRGSSAVAHRERGLSCGFFAEPCLWSLFKLVLLLLLLLLLLALLLKLLKLRFGAISGPTLSML